MKFMSVHLQKYKISFKNYNFNSIFHLSNANYKISGIVMNAMTEQYSYGAGYYYNYYEYYYGDNK